MFPINHGLGGSRKRLPHPNPTPNQVGPSVPSVPNQAPQPAPGGSRNSALGHRPAYSDLQTPFNFQPHRPDANGRPQNPISHDSRFGSTLPRLWEDSSPGSSSSSSPVGHPSASAPGTGQPYPIGRPVSPPPGNRADFNLHPQRPPEAHLATQNQSEMRNWFEGGPQDLGAHTRLAWENKPTQAPTASRAPTEVETAALRRAAQDIKNSQAGGGYPGSASNGEHAGTTDYRVNSQGQVEIRPVSQNYAAGGSVNHNVPEGSHPPIYWHSHPTRPDMDAMFRRPETANTMPSKGDVHIAGDHYASHGAKNYQILGDQVNVYDGKSPNVTRLDPSPLQGMLDRAPTPHPSIRPGQTPPPAEVGGTSSWGGHPSAFSTQRPTSNGGESSSSGDGLFQKPVR